MPIRVTHGQAVTAPQLRAVRVHEPAELAGRFHASELVGQFVLAHEAALVPDGWHSHELGEWRLGVHPRLPVIALHTSDGAHIGWLLGHPIDPAGRMITGRLTVPCTRPVWVEAFEDAIYGLGGRWVALLVSPRAQRVYLDPAGSMGAVFSPAHRMVASTTTLVPYSRGCEDDHELLHDFGIPHRNGLLPFGLTSRKGVTRILPDHCLDLATWQSRRHWPVAPLAGVVDARLAAGRVADIVRRHVAAVTQARATYAGLTAGYDSRMVAACTRDCLDRIEFITFALPDSMARIDCDVASHLARRVGLPHRVVPWVAADEMQMERWVWRSGGDIGEVRGRAATAMYHRLDPSRAEITGQAGELCRASYWIDAGRPREVRIGDILRVLGAPMTPRMTALADAWLRGLPARDTIQVYDFLYIEMWLGCWAGVLPYAEPDATAFRVYPLVHRDAFVQMLRLPNECKARGAFPRRLIAGEWPRLLGVPFNRPVGVRHYTRQVRKRVWKARQAAQRWSRAALFALPVLQSVLTRGQK